MATRLDVLLI